MAVEAASCRGGNRFVVEAAGPGGFGGRQVDGRGLDNRLPPGGSAPLSGCQAVTETMG